MSTHPPDIDHVSRVEAQKFLNISAPTFYRFIAKGELNAFKIGRATRVKLSEIERFLNTCPAVVSRSH